MGCMGVNSSEESMNALDESPEIEATSLRFDWRFGVEPSAVLNAIRTDLIPWALGLQPPGQSGERYTTVRP